MANRTNSFGIDYKQLVVNYAKQNSVKSPIYYFQQDSKYLPCNYFCSLIVSGRSFSTQTAYSTKHEAEMQAAKQGCIELNLVSSMQQQMGSYSFAGPTVPLYTGQGDNNIQYVTTPALYDTSTGRMTNDHQLQKKKSLQSEYTSTKLTNSNIQVHKDKSNNAFLNSGCSVKSQPICPRNKPNSHKEPPIKLPKMSSEDWKSMNTSTDALGEPIPVDKIDDIWKYLTDDVLATSFKTFLCIFAQKDKLSSPVYETLHTSENGFSGVKGKVIFNGREFESIGLMRQKKQAELSAAEVCLRTLGYLPLCSNLDRYTIQPFRGGLLKGQARQKTKCFAIVVGLCQHLGLPDAVLRVKRDNENDEKYKAVCWFDDKIFETAQGFQTFGSAKEEICINVLQYLNVNIDKTIGIAKFNVKIEDETTLKLPFLSPAISPFYNLPSVSFGWLHDSVLEESDTLSYNGEDISLDFIKEKMTVQCLKKSGAEDPYVDFLHQPPMFDGVPVQFRSDIAVGQVLPGSGHLVLIGNKQFSIKLFCKDRQLYCKQRDCQVQVMAGHHIVGLECEYITLPTLDVYVRAHTCDDLFFPNPSKPVIRSCNAIVILHDHDVCNSPFVLFHRPIAPHGFPNCSKLLSDYLSGIIMGKTDNTLDVSELTSNISSWNTDDLSLLFEMSMESLQQLYSQFQRYDNRWNEVFIRPLTKELLELKKVCGTELSRRRSRRKPANATKVMRTDNWKLPHFQFKPRFSRIGPMIERSDLCTVRGLRNATGIRLKLGDVEKVPSFDIPVSEPNARGVFDRYYIWAEVKQTNEMGEHIDNYFARTTIDFESDEWVQPNVVHGTDKNMRTRRTSSSQPDTDLEKQQPTDMEASDGGDENTKTTSSTIDDLKVIKQECRWFSVSTTALAANPSFKHLVQSEEFQSSLASLTNTS